MKGRVGDNRSKHILQIRMIEEFEAQLSEFAKEMRVKDPFAKQEPEQEEEAKDKRRVYEEFSSHSFQQFLRKVDLLNMRLKWDTQVFSKLLLALTPVE